MPVVSYVWLSNSPPIVGVSCHQSSSTLALVAASRRFSLCWLEESQARAYSFLATHSGKEMDDKLTRAGLAHLPGSKLGVPVVKDSVAYLECRMVQKRRFGDHILIIGAVAAALASEDFGEYWRFKSYAPILYTGWQGKLGIYRARRTESKPS